MEQKLQPYTCHGRKEQPIEVSTGEILDAIVKGQYIEVHYAFVNGNRCIDKNR